MLVKLLFERIKMNLQMVPTSINFREFYNVKKSGAKVLEKRNVRISRRATSK